MGCSDYAGIEGPDNADPYGNNLVNGWVTNTTYPNGVPYTKTPFAHGMMPKLAKLPSTGPLTSQAISPRWVTDGLSKTMIVGEMAGRGFNWSGNKIAGTWADGLNIGVILMGVSGPPTAAVPTTLTADTSTKPGSYTSWCPAYGADELIGFHPAGCMILLCDGSAQFMTQEVSLPIILALCSRDGTETIEQGVIGD